MSRDGFHHRTRAVLFSRASRFLGRGAADGGPARLALLALALLAALGCAEQGPKPIASTWIVGQSPPSFDPHGPPDGVRWAVLRLLSRGLVEEDASGRIVPAAAESVGITRDGLTYTFRIRRGLSFADGRPCASQDFRRALEQGLTRLDHGTHRWLLGSLVGMDRVRPGRPLPALGIATPDEHMLVLRLATPDSLLLHKLAIPGVGMPFHAGAGGDWGDGIGAYRVLASTPSTLTLLRRSRDHEDGPDTLNVRFAVNAGRSRSLLRSGSVDLVWPLPPGLLAQPLPPGYQVGSAPARPARHLLLVLRPDLAPTSRPAARHALSHGLNRSEILATLGRRAEAVSEWLVGGGAFRFPSQDVEEVRAWMERGDLGRSLHVVMAYQADGVASEIARSMQVEWARLGLDVELRPLRGSTWAAERLRRGGAQALLVETQPLIDDPAAEVASLVVPALGPSVGPFRSGWSTREFGPWLLGYRGSTTAEAGEAQDRLAGERIAIPLARLPWVWVEAQREGHSAHPHYGPDPRGTHPVLASFR
jgi:peptide/nickel transport system substrate-binding protein/oligopeptide transport system substrate-binding protein